MPEQESKPEFKTHPIRRGLASAVMVASFGAVLESGSVPPEIIQSIDVSAPTFEDDYFSVTTANVHGWRHKDGGSNLDELLEVLEKRQTDVACLQEVFISEGQIQDLYEKGFNVIFAQTKHYPMWGQFGIAVISPHKIELKEVYSLPPKRSERPRVALSFDLMTNRGRLRFMTAHLSPERSNRQRQARRVVDISSGIGAQLFCADVNDEENRLGALGFGRAFSLHDGSDLAGTFPSYGRDKKTIDFVLDNCDIQPEAKYEEWVDDFGSDHMAYTRRIMTEVCLPVNPSNNIASRV